MPKNNHKPNSKDKNNKKDKDNNRKKKNKKKYKVRNWHEYNESLKKRGMLDVYVDESMLEEWEAQPKKRKPGAQLIYSNLAIQITLQFGKVFRQKLRQTEGLVKSLFKLMDIKLAVPNFSTLSRRGENIAVRMPKDDKEKIVAIVDSSGLKVFGEGEWKVRKHGYSKRRTWLKIHLLITPDHEIRAAKLTANNKADCKVVRDLFEQEKAVIETLAGDGAYDKEEVYDNCQDRNIKKILIPPQKNAKILQNGNSKLPSHPRDKNLRQIRRSTRKKWKEKSGYHIRSLVETAMFRFKSIFGDKINARKPARQKNEFLISVAALNKMTNFGMPDSYAVT